MAKEKIEPLSEEPWTEEDESRLREHYRALDTAALRRILGEIDRNHGRVVDELRARGEERAHGAPRIFPLSPGWRAELAEQIAARIYAWATTGRSLDITALPTAIDVLGLVQGALDSQNEAVRTDDPCDLRGRLEAEHDAHAKGMEDGEEGRERSPDLTPDNHPHGSDARLIALAYREGHSVGRMLRERREVGRAEGREACASIVHEAWRENIGHTAGVLAEVEQKIRARVPPCS
jgi:hypothetical protein